MVLLVSVASAQNQDSLAQLLVKKHITYNSERLSTPGFRIQIFSANQRIPANEARSLFLGHYPDISSYLIYQQPNFKVRVGDCRTRLEALKIRELIRKDFPNAFLVRDEIKLPEARSTVSE